MRQIHICAWIVLSLAACSGEEFSTGSMPPSDSGARAGSPALGNAQAGNASGTGGGDGNTSGGTGGAEVYVAGAGSNDSEASAGESASSPGEPDGNGPGQPATDCASGSVTFRMLPSPKLGAEYLCDAGCGTGWLSITDKDGATGLPISSACGTASCEACEVRQCAAAACLATPLTARGTELTWDGAYLAKDTCGASKLVCQRRECVKPGKYKARACAATSADTSVGGACTPTEERLCAEVDFEFPGTRTVELVLGAGP